MRQLFSISKRIQEEERRWKHSKEERKEILGKKACMRKETARRKSSMHACREDLTMLGLGFL
jgi:hypothetical protein